MKEGHPTDGVETMAVHAGDPHPRIGGAATPPIFRSTVFEHSGEPGDYHDIVYPRLNNLPNHLAVAGKLAALEGAEEAIPTASGMAAISTVLLSVLADGGHLLVQRQLYGGTHMLVTGFLERFGIAYDWIDGADPSGWAEKVRPETRLIHVEAMSNPLTRVIDLDEVVRFARAHGILSCIDATFVTPILFRPVPAGFDLVVHSATKYLNGHSDVTAGAIVGSTAHLAPVRELLNELGGTLDPEACMLLHRGMRTLPLRMRAHCENALALARALEAQETVAAVHYPGLASHPDHARARQHFAGEAGRGFGGMLSFEPKGGVEAARRCLARLRLPVSGPSLGGVETLVTRPATTSHAGLSGEERARAGVTDSLIRVSVGIETAADLVADFTQALAD